MSGDRRQLVKELTRITRALVRLSERETALWQRRRRGTHARLARVLRTDISEEKST